MTEHIEVLKGMLEQLESDQIEAVDLVEHEPGSDFTEQWLAEIKEQHRAITVAIKCLENSK